MMNFSEILLPASLQAALLGRGYTEATPVQEAIVAPEYQSGDILVSSKTGSGKTVAFGLAFAPQLLAGAEVLPRSKAPQVLVVAPTRELAQQVAEELSWLYRPAKGVVATCVGGVDIRREQRLLAQGAHIVVGTPGRLCDHIKRKSLSLDSVVSLVLDEADEMLDMGFREELEFILEAAQSRTRTLLFSATLPPEIERLAKKYTKDAKRLSISTNKAHEDIEYLAHSVAKGERDGAVINLLRFYEAKSALVFVATREGVTDLQELLLSRGFSAVGISGELNQANRDRAIQAMRQGHARVLVATDVAARGLDLPEVGLVIHADLPYDPLVLQHRSGRTGRAGQKGIAVLLVPAGRERYLERQLREAKVHIKPTPLPEKAQIQKADEERFSAGVLSLLSEVTEEERLSAQELLQKHTAEELVSVLVRRMRQSLPAIEELPFTRKLHTRAKAPEQHHIRAERGSSGAERAMTGGVWFRLNLGRAQSADPKWLVPMLCRRGKIQKSDIGEIRIQLNETTFTIDPGVASMFEESASLPDAKDPKIWISRLLSSSELRTAKKPFGKKPTFAKEARGRGARLA